ncbi:putative TDP-N-acetylfucosamine:lipid II N-acetylfucosaminyltransferase [Vibrio chagasii]|nr:putative TDP-N-acetylfucosamine:lipid II N-acetylfucosaminyltransferase [Vibrio chagasii]
MGNKVVHIVSNEKFIKPFIEIINENFNNSEHLFINISNSNNKRFPLPIQGNVVEFKKNLSLFKNILCLFKECSYYLRDADKIIVHGVLNRNFNKYLYFNPSILAKSYWVMWGGDLYQPLIQPANTLKKRFHQLFERKIKGGFLGYITYIPGDFELAKKLYNAKGKYYECIIYPSNLYSNILTPGSSNKNITFLVGNSADPTNNHKETLEKLSKLEDQSFDIICPLSYGIKEYAEEIKQFGHSRFGKRFTALTDFMPYDEYLNLLAKVDIAVFAHKRQQAMGNTITLLGLGKTVYMRKDVTPFSFFKSINVEVKDFNELSLSLLEKTVIDDNKINIKRYFSKDSLVNQLQRIFEG